MSVAIPIQPQALRAFQADCAAPDAVCNTPTPAHVWTLAQGRAETFHAQTDGVLSARCGRVWATLGASPGAPTGRDADHFVVPGMALALRAGQSAVLESWPLKDQQHATLQWLPA